MLILRVTPYMYWYLIWNAWSMRECLAFWLLPLPRALRSPQQGWRVRALSGAGVRTPGGKTHDARHRHFCPLSYFTSQSVQLPQSAQDPGTGLKDHIYKMLALGRNIQIWPSKHGVVSVPAPALVWGVSWTRSGAEGTFCLFQYRSHNWRHFENFYSFILKIM